MPGNQVAGAVAVVTGGASGIGRALAQRFAAEDARAVVVADLDVQRARAVAQSLPVEAVGMRPGVSLSCLCPGVVRTPMTAGRIEINAVAAAVGNGSLESEEVAEAVVTAITGDRFLILPHPEAAEHERFRAAGRDRWLAATHRIWRKLYQNTAA